MNTISKPAWRAILAVIMFFGAGCASTEYRRSAGAYLDDTGTTARVKTALLRDPIVSGTAVNVDVFRGHTTLSGFIASEEERQRAGQIARMTPGVQWVNNTLVLKTELPNTARESVGRPGAQIDVGTGSSGQTSLQGPSQGWQRGISRDDLLNQSMNRDTMNGDVSRRSTGLDTRTDLRTTEPGMARPSESTESSANRAAPITNPQNQNRPAVPPGDIRIEAMNGVATVQGTVSSEDERIQIGSKLLQIPGVERVNNELVVRQRE